MADISMCNREHCPLGAKCYRKTAPKSLLWQSYQTYTPVFNEKTKEVECTGFKDNKKFENNKRPRGLKDGIF
jgi:hypothetical protein